MNMIMNLGRKKIQKAASTTQCAVLMVQKSASWSASIYYLYYQINLINNLVACIGMMDWYFQETHLNRKQAGYEKT